ncbi:carbohydrate ABC transporter permease [Acidomonas methanolica]|uniref:carbohydrate ABC transporter permease n=1 Tax=Acidomonas methanolica TaxID=437 RepID=UPI00211A4ACF|nr:carbohydrate ABC transporter permease [Acidomonas methanolica]MCQ9156431.1 carbohydrate ABC transporter permease [Acidomonas methanolica]
MKPGTVILALVALLSLAPFWLLLENALKAHAAIVADPLSFPFHPDWRNFVSAWRDGRFGHALLNSVLLCATSVCVTVTFSALAAYPLARGTAPRGQAILLYFLCSVTVPIQIFLFPLFFLFARLGLIGNVFATGIVLAAINLPLAILLLRASVAAIPRGLDDAAFMDGAGPWRCFFFVILPLMRPGLVTVATVTWLASWNEFLITSTFQQGDDNFTMTLAYRAMNGTLSVDQGLLMAGALIILLPVIFLFLAVQRLFVEGMTAGSVKG